MIGDPSGTSRRAAAPRRGNAGAERRRDPRPAVAVPRLPAGPDRRPDRGQLRLARLRFGLIEFLRDIGKHFTVPYMLTKDSVQQRLGEGLSFTEFSYMLLQAADFLHLYRTMGVELQTGGADQWGNITAGLELIRKVERVEGGGDPAHALSFPLLLKSNGAEVRQVRGRQRVARRRSGPRPMPSTSSSSTRRTRRSGGCCGSSRCSTARASSGSRPLIRPTRVREWHSGRWRGT